MRAVVTVLRAPVGATAAAATATVDYVSGARQTPLPSPDAAATTTPGTSVVGYFADQTPEGPGRWVGAGAHGFGLAGSVERAALEALLRGEDPHSGTDLIAGPTRPSTPRPSDEVADWGQAEFTFREAGSLLGLSDRYLRKVAGRTRALLVHTGGDAQTLAAVHGTRAFLVAHQGSDGWWRVGRDELLRFASSRRTGTRVIGYDVTFSVPKSVSLLWARGDAPTRTAVLEAFDRAVDAGLGYLERHGVMTGRDAERARARGLTGAAFRHLTSRALDPQVHTHVVVANVTERDDGTRRAVAGRGLFEHAKTAAYLAGAQLRSELTARLGVGWRPVRSGIVEVAGVPVPAIEAMSVRRVEIDAAADALAVTSAGARRELALRTRSVKQVESLASLQPDWEARLDEAGFGAGEHAACLDRAIATAPTPGEVDEVFTRLVRHDGLTAHSATFTRQDVVQVLADWSIERLDANGIEALADAFLDDARVLELAADTNRPSSGRERWFTTRTMVAAEMRVLDGFRRGVRAAPSGIDPAVIGAAIEQASFLAEDQRRALEQLCRSRHRVQCLVGPAGSGKTALLGVAASAWSAAGQRVVGVTVQGTAAEHLELATGIPSQTVAAFLARIERDDPRASVGAGTVVVVDEASAVGTFDLARLLNVVEVAGARMVLVGDPAQHGAVSAGGGFASLTRRWSHLAARLAVTHRQVGPEMANVRAAVDELRRRDTDTGLHRLLVDGRVHDAGSRVAAYDAIVRDWATDRTHSSETPDSARRVCMITDDHRTRRALITRARAHLQARGELTGPVLRAGGQEFQAGDEVIARAPVREVHPPGAPDRHVRNGTCGRVAAIEQPRAGVAPGMWVDFDHRGVIFVPAAVLEGEIRPGVAGVLTHSYALTSHAAQGATYDVARMVATEATGPAALYVGTSRARGDLRVYTAPHHDTTSAEAPDPARASTVVRDGETGLQSLARAVRHRGDERLAIDRDPTLSARLNPETTPAPAPGVAVEIAPPDNAVLDIDPIVPSL